MKSRGLQMKLKSQPMKRISHIIGRKGIRRLNFKFLKHVGETKI